MSDRLYSLLGGPVSRQEYRRSTRGLLPFLLTCAYAIWLLLLSLGYMRHAANATAEQSAKYTNAVIPPPLRWRTDVDGQQYLTAEQLWFLKRLEFQWALGKAAEYVSLLLHQQLALILFAIPLLTAGAIVREKEKDTLQALFGTDLSSAEIVVGKILGRLAGILQGALAILPPLAFAVVLAEMPVSRVLLALVQAGVLAFALSSACVFLSLWTRRASDAIIGSYSAMVIVYLLVQMALSVVSVPVPLDPLSILSRLLSNSGQLPLFPYLLHLTAWATVGVVCCALVAARLRPVSIGLMDAQPPRWQWALRPRVSDDPVRWRELHFLGLAPFPVLRKIPRWLGRLSVLTVSCVIAGDSFTRAVGRDFYSALSTLDFATAQTLLLHPKMKYFWWDVHLMGSLLLVVGCLTVGVRCAGSILEEKRRKTWEDLILTPLTMREILQGKYRGIVQAAVLPVTIYALPMLALSTLGGVDGIETALLWVGATCVLIPLAGSLGLAIASRSENEAEAVLSEPKLT
jgi:ABC-type Na+ efflux pump permease subunit